MNTLYIVGNGFDLHHDLETKYQHFGVFLKNGNQKIYDNLLYYYGLPHLNEKDEDYLNNPLWSEFEQSLADLDVDQVLEVHSNLVANLSSADFRDRDWHGLTIEMEMFVNDLTLELIKEFKEFILNVKYPVLDSGKRLSLNENSIYLNFNYTDSLESYYGINENQILYIHKKAASSNDLILGHGFDPEIFTKKEEAPPENISKEDFECWNEYMSDRYEYSFVNGKDELLKYFRYSFKETKKVIEENEMFFRDLCGVNKVIVLGHSLSEVDRPYLIKVKESINQNAAWCVTYLGNEEREKHRNSLHKIGVNDESIKLVEMNSLINAIAI